MHPANAIANAPLKLFFKVAQFCAAHVKTHRNAKERSLGYCPWGQLQLTKAVCGSPRTVERVSRTKIVSRLNLCVAERSRVACKQLGGFSGLIPGRELVRGMFKTRAELETTKQDLGGLYVFLEMLNIFDAS